MKNVKNAAKFRLEGLSFSSGIKNDTEEIFLVTTGTADAKYSLINNYLYQLIGVVHLGEIKKNGMK